MKAHGGSCFTASLIVTMFVFFPAPPASTEAAGSPAEITVVGSEFQFEPARSQVKQGENVTLLFKNEGALSHNLTIRRLGVATETIQGDEQDRIHFAPEMRGTFRFVCTVPGHKEAGMVGSLTVVGE